MPYDGEVCRHVLGVSSSVFVPVSVADAVTVADSVVYRLLSLLSRRCRNVTVGTLCRYAFPSCAVAGGAVESKPLCR